MIKKLANNIPLKLISLCVGIVIWILVTNINNPVVSRSYVIQNVEILNEAYIDEVGLKCMQDESQDSVRVTVTTERKNFNRITMDDIRVTADLKQAVSLDTDPVMVPLQVYCPTLPNAAISVSPQNFGVHLEEKLTQEFAVTVSSGESQPGKGYEIGSQTSSPEKIRITGPKSLIQKIDKVTAKVNVEGITSDETESVVLTITDKNGDVLKDSSMHYLKIDNDGKVNVTTRLWKVKTDVKIKSDYVGEPAEGYQVTGISTLPDTIAIAGNEEALQELKENGNEIVIPSELVDVTDLEKDKEYKVSLTEVLNDGLKLTAGTSEDVWVNVQILPVDSASYNVPTSNIGVKNLPDDKQLLFNIDKIVVRIHAVDQELSDFNEMDIDASITLSDDIEEGTQEVPVAIKLPDGYELLEDVTTEVTISKANAND
ncbi:MAG: CdaR family protein [Eubacteriales bacterium]|nr:CdaR family protein [Eubacteriales bacterium]